MLNIGNLEVGQTQIIADSVKTLSPKIVLPIWDYGLPPLLIKSRFRQQPIVVCCTCRVRKSQFFKWLRSQPPRVRSCDRTARYGAAARTGSSQGQSGKTNLGAPGRSNVSKDQARWK
jgi:hypothetical protein